MFLSVYTMCLGFCVLSLERRGITECNEGVVDSPRASESNQRCMELPLHRYHGKVQFGGFI